MSGGYRGGDPRRGGVRGGYGHDPRYRPREADEPDDRDRRGAPDEEYGDAPMRYGPAGEAGYDRADQQPPWRGEGDQADGVTSWDEPGSWPGGGRGAAAEHGSGNLSDLWREPDPWAADSRRGLEAWRERDPWPDQEAPARADRPRPDEDPPRAPRFVPNTDRRPSQPRGRDWYTDDGAPDEAPRWPARSPGDVPAAGQPRRPAEQDQPGYPPNEGYPANEGYRGTPDDAYLGQREDPRRGTDRGTDAQRGGTYPRPGAGQRPPENYRRPPESYQSPVTWSGPPVPPSPPAGAAPPGRDAPRREPDAPTEAHRNPAGWRDGDDGPGDQAGRGNGNASQGERAWWDDAFRPAPPRSGQSAPPRPGRPGEPGQPGRPSRPDRPRPASAQGYGVPPGELTQPIPLYQPQGAYVADAYRVAEPYDDEPYDDEFGDAGYAPERAPGRARAPQQERATPAGTSMARSTGSMALGTLISRVTGFLRTLVFAIALGDAVLANSYNNANTIPNAVYDVMIGGVLTSVVVPLLVKAAKEHRDGGEAYDQRIFTLSVVALGAVTIVATVAAGLLVDLYAASVHGSEHRLMVVFAYFFIPQIFFYGMSSLIGAILNTRNSFIAPMWTPIINNVIVIAVGVLFVLTVGLHKGVSDVSSGGILLLGVGTTLGIVVQTLALVPALRKVGFRWRPRFDFRRAELSEIGRMAVWMLGYVVSTQITFIVTTNVANAASVHVQGAGVTAYNYSYSLFLLPYAVIGVSVTTALLPRMSRHAAEGRYWLVRDDFSQSIRLSSVILVPAALLLAVLGPPLCEFLFGYGSMTVADARYIGEAFGAFSLGLMPFVIFQLLLRVFYALHDSRTPAIIGFLTMIATVIGNFIVLAILPPGQVVVGMAFVYGLTSVFSAAIAWRLLNKRVGSLDGRVVTRSLVRMHVASIPALVFALVASTVIGVVLHPGPIYGFITVLVGGGGALLLYVIVAKALRLDELSQLTHMVAGRFGRGA